ncbi:MAG: gliding motility-associated C-terminal domain-containing protein [Ferruginibacter sp.]
MRFFLFLLLICGFSVNAQPPCTSAGPGGTAESSISVCTSSPFNQTNLPACIGPNLPLSSCPDPITSNSSIWYKINCYSNGTLGFVIQPNTPGDDYDWVLMDVTNNQPGDVYTTNLAVSLNQKSTGTATGCTPAGVGNFGCAGAPGNAFNSLVPVLSGNEYLLMITRYSSAGTAGYSLNFTGGTALLTNSAVPAVTSVAQLGCNPSQIRVNFSEDIRCNSVTTPFTPGNTEFVISNGSHTITGIAYSCNAGSNSFSTLTLTLQNPLPPGNYTLTVNQGFDLNTLLDVCGDAMVAGVPVAFNIPPQTPPTITQVTKANCAGSILKVALSQPIQCSSISGMSGGSSNGSEFSMSPNGPTINSVTTNCSGINLSTDTIYINLNNPLADGSYTLTVNSGTDGNTFTDNCGILMAVGANRTFAIATTPAPTVTTPLSFCQGATAAALQPTGTNLLWYANATGGTGSATMPTVSTTTAGTFNFFVSQTIGGCEGPRATITVTVNAAPNPPTVTAPVINYCVGNTSVTLTAGGTNLLWYPTATGGLGNSTAPSVSTTTAGTTIYYVSQNNGTCESLTRTSITVNVFPTPAAPTVTSPIDICQGSTAAQLTASGNSLLWYTSATGGSGTSTAPAPPTATLGTTDYFVSQTTIGTITCESPRALIRVNIVTSPSAATVTTPVDYCQNQTVPALTAGGSNLMWYTTPTITTGTSTAPTPSTTTIGSTIYYVAQVAGTCQGPRAAITVNVATTPPALTVTPQVNYCVGNTAVPLPTPTGTNIKWYTVPTAGTSSNTAPTPNTATAGTTNYYVTQSIGTCESPRAQIPVVVTAIPAAPQVGNVPGETSLTINYCQGEIPHNFPVTGTNLLWYTNATDGIGNPVAPTVSTVAVSTNTYYVSQSSAGCEGPRSSITVNVNVTLPPPTVPAPQTYCQNTPTNPIVVTASGSLKWYTQATGGSSTTTTPVVSSAVAGTMTYYVSQTSGNCESPRAAVTINITATPAAPTVSSIINFCPNQTVGLLSDSVTGTNLLWYANATGGSGSNISPIINTTIFPATYTFFVSQSSSATNGNCEGPRAQITVNVDNFLNVNIKSDTTICEGIAVRFFPTVTPAGALYQWRSLNEPNSTIDNTSILNATVRPLNNSEYVLRATFGGCVREDSVRINVKTKPVVNINASPTAICISDSALLTGIVTRVTTPGIISAYKWTPTVGIRYDTALQTYAYPGTSTVYTLTATTTVADYGCDFVSTGTVNVIVQPSVFADAGRDTIAVKGSPHQLQASGAAFYEWSSPTATINNPFTKNPFTVLNDDAVFYLKATDAIGCVGTDTVFVKVLNGPAYYVPNAFTPNGDGQNDIFRAIPAGLANTTYFRVFNRYGVVMFETNQYLKGWDGTFNGKPQLAGVYVWMIAGTDKNFKKIALNGTVNLIR